MKKIILSIILLAVIIPASFAQFTKIAASTSYNYNYHFNNEQFPDHLVTKLPALSFSAIYEVNLPIHIVPKINIYLPNVTKEDLVDYVYKTSVIGFSLDVDAHYVFNSLDKFELYGLGGINILYAHRKITEEFGGQVNFSDTGNDNALGLNLGAGAYWMVKDEFDLFFEAKLIVASQVQLVGTFGILLNMETLWKKEKDSGY